MKKVLILLLSICSVACQKKIAGTGQPDPLVARAQAFFNGVLSQKLPANSANYRANQVRVPAWDQAVVKNLSVGPAVVVPVTFQNKMYLATDLAGSYLLDISQITKLVIFKDSSGQYHYQVLTLIPDSTSILHPASFMGIALSEDWSGNSLVSPQRIRQPLMTSTTSQRPIVADEFAITTCDVISGYNYAVGDAANGETWEETSCTTYDIGGGGADASASGVGSGDYSDVGGGGDGAASTIKIEPPTNPIGNIADYFKCFTNDGGNDHTYKATLAVEQPNPGTRTSWGLSGTGSSSSGNPVNVGHTWLILTETTAYGSTTRNVGFYPAGLITPLYPSNQGELNDDEATTYNIALTITIDNAQFFNILNFLSQGNNTGYLYNLNTNNCSTFTLNALRAGDIDITTRTGTWLNGGGDDPGDLGEDILSMPLSSNMSLQTVSNYHPNVGSCN